MDIEFKPATITENGRAVFGIIARRHAVATIKDNGYELDVDHRNRLLIGVPYGHDTVFTVGPYTITLDA